MPANATRHSAHSPYATPTDSTTHPPGRIATPNSPERITGSEVPQHGTNSTPPALPIVYPQRLHCCCVMATAPLAGLEHPSQELEQRANDRLGDLEYNLNHQIPKAARTPARRLHLRIILRRCSRPTG